MNSYELSRSWFDYCYLHPEKIKPVHTSIYFFAIEHCNRLGWKERFGFPTTMAMEALGIKSYNTFIKHLNEIVEFGFITMVERAKNQYSSNIIALSKFDKALDNALDKALIKHTSKQSESTVQSIDSIIKQLNKEQLTNKQVTKLRDVLKKYDLKVEIVYPFEDQEFINLWNVWKGYKKDEHKFSYKSSASEQASLMDLQKKSANDLKKAIAIIHQSIANGWKGFFELKQTQNGKSTSIGTTLTEEEKAILRDKRF